MLNMHLDLLPEVADALAIGRPVVALESTIISHGMPYPQNVETARRVEQVVRDNGAVPATIAIMGGRLKVGLETAELEALGQGGAAVIKCSRRDIPFVLAGGGMGATTVASTMIVAAMAGIRVFATGGIGGVHRGAQESFDISADLQELARTEVAVVCAGAKSILDIGLTLEYLETQGVPVIGYGCEELPAFYTRESGFKVDYRLDSAEDIAKALRLKWELGLSGGVVVANPIPEPYAMPKADIDDVIHQALQEAEERGIKGKAATPFLLARVCELTGGESLASNIRLVLNNAELGARIAVAMAAA
ncbi:pseudouridine-5'-phosphate glycosidase [Aeromonas simiae]|uniref:pseudouridine-5'-phosphate glycosidase n=1 Tax=Aeromonas simiae TaxID=218936 RepID=UPI0005A7AB39|nr:pseudouridine-5'-phosphate glycosidase [Aeromonas simiae]MDO2947510.1 pseudouridine-5'-phosphate glycosidase [Aeromonas simiae]MDO2951601.1 pseudouridine-5'-phosphate glycosidase [Aeromonas simiae]MDO2955070.1 pseudouridine-5'-phosphate glycosidase [Aeromonas simiae]